LPSERIGLSWLTTRTYGRDIVWHNGGTGGFHSFIGLDPDRRVAVVVLANSARDIDDIGMHLLEPRLPLAGTNQPGGPPAGRSEITLAPAQLERLTGVYDLTPQFSLTIARGPEGLTVRATGQSALPIFPVSPTEFFLRAVSATITFQVDADGNVTGLVLHQNGQDLPANRRARQP